MEEKLKSALLEAANWENQMTDDKRTKLSYSDARLSVVERIFEKYKNDTLKLWNVVSEPIYPVGGCLIILAYDEAEANRIASKTIENTAVFTVEEIPMDKPSVVEYQSGDY